MSTPTRSIVRYRPVLATLALFAVACGGDTTAPSAPPFTGEALDPAGNWQMIVAAEGWSCGLAKSGATYCWGINDRGELGDSTLVPKQLPTAVVGGHRFVSLAANHYTVCALSDDAQAFCWGFYNDLVSVPALVTSQLRFTSIAVGDYQVCAVSTDSIPYCWTTIHGAPGGPTAVGNNLQLTAIAGAQFQFCGVTPIGSVACWQGNEAGDSQLTNIAMPATAMSVATGPVHACALTKDGSAHCWGKNIFGQLGDGTTTDRASPVAVSGGHRMASIAANGSRTCAVGADSLAYCWGIIPGDASHTQPTLVHPQLRFAQISVGADHSCGVTPSGAGYCWGVNGAGQLGAGMTETSIPTPVRVIDPP